MADCERVVDAALAQPVLAITSLAYAVAGLAVLWWAVRVRAVLAGAAGVVLLAVGVGSFAFHGPQPPWAGPAHDWPIIALAVVYVVGLALTVRRRPRMWLAAAGILAMALIAYAAGRSGSPLCRPESLWQYHGAWHVLTAAAAAWAALALGSFRAHAGIAEQQAGPDQ
jgi:predicted membrane channel-forming protein YqfA (hemolysin III family)